MSYPTCDHLKEDGILCGSPALRGKKLCFYHHRNHQRQQYAERIIRANDPLRPGAPIPTTPFDLQVTLYEIMTAAADNSLHIRRAWKLLLALQQRSASGRKPTS